MAVRLFVGNLPYDVTEAELRAHFAAVGPLAYLSLATDRDTGAADTRPDAGRDFGPDAAPRRRRPPAKRAAHADHGPKRPMYKRAAGPVRFSAVDDDGDEEEEHGAHGTRRRADAGEHDTA